MEISATYIFRFLVIPIGILIAYFSYEIFALTKGGSKGWRYIAIAGLCFSAWAICQIVFTLLFDSALVRMMLGTFLFGLIVILAPLGPIILVNDMKLSPRARLFTVKRYLLYIAPISALVIAYNVIDPSTIFIAGALSITHLLVGFALLPMAYATFFLWRESKSLSWAFIFAFVSILSISVFMGVYSGSCCGTDGAYYGNPVCSSYDTDYVSSLPVSCSAGVLAVTLKWNYLQIIAVLSGLVGFYLLWNPMRSKS